MRIEIVCPWPPAALSPNARVHHMARARVVKAARAQAYLLAREALSKAPEEDKAQLRSAIESGDTVAFWVDFYPPTRRHYDDDNLISRFKAARDGIAQALGIDDRKFRTLPFVQTETHKGGRVVVRITDMPEMAQREACAVSAGKEKPGSNGVSAPCRAIPQT